MRWLLVAVAALATVACTEHGKGGGVFCSFMGQTHQVGDQFPAGDGCNFCDCDVDGDVVCTTDPCRDGGPLPDGANACGPEGNCPNGPICEFSCCEVGEQCIGGVCSCGGGAACTGGDICASGGPVGGGSCGQICCGATMGCPI